MDTENEKKALILAGFCEQNIIDHTNSCDAYFQGHVLLTDQNKMHSRLYQSYTHGFTQPCRSSQMILESSPESREEYQLGTTKVFLREGFEQHLERLRRRVETDAAVKIQRNVSHRRRRANTEKLESQTPPGNYRET